VRHAALRSTARSGLDILAIVNPKGDLMDFTKLAATATLARKALLEHGQINGNSAVCDSIISQLDFIIKHANNCCDPRSKLTQNQTFTYSILASREFCSPDELTLKEYLDAVSREMYPEDY